MNDRKRHATIVVRGIDGDVRNGHDFRRGKASMTATYLILAALLAMLTAGCATGPIRPETLTIDGQVVHQEIEGGFWAINADDGRRFVPMALPDAYRKTQLRLRVKAVRRPDLMGTQMYGPIIEIQEISVLP